MKNELKINREFITQYFKDCTILNQTDFLKNWMLQENLVKQIYPESYNEKHMEIEKEIFPMPPLEWSVGFCSRYKIPKQRIGDLAMIYMIIREAKSFTDFANNIFVKGTNEKLGINRKLKKLSQKIILDSPGSNRIEQVKKSKAAKYICEINFIGVRKDDTIKIKSPFAINEIFRMVADYYLKNKFEGLPFYKNRTTHDIRVFSWALLNYLNKFTQYKATKGILATNQQCKLIYQLLKEADFLNDRPEEDMDDVNYIRAYLKQTTARL